MNEPLIKIQAHLFIRQKITKQFIVTFILFWLLMLLAIFGNRFIPNFEANHYFLIVFTLIWLLIIGFFIMTFRTLSHVNCPICRTKTNTSSTHPKLPDQYSAYCKSCNILWDLGIGKGD